jgi:ribosomal protein L7/L12
MKIELTKSQLLAILSQHFNVTVDEVTICDSTMADLLQREITQFYYATTQKIQAIKHLRQLSIDQKWLNGEIMGLADAKWAVENFPCFIDFVRKNNRLPQAGYSELK